MNHPSFLVASLCVAFGGGTGAWLRFLVGRLYVALLGPVRATAFPWATLSVNVIGSLAMGVLVGWLARHSSASGISSEGARLFLAVGVLGGFTTFSSFSMEMVLLAERGQMGVAAFYALVSLMAGVAGMFVGLAVMRAAG